MHRNLKYYLLIALLEGASVMAVELTGAKLIAPWFGTSLYVWASVLGVTMMGLAGGYFTGGIVSERMSGSRTLYRTLALAALFTGIMPLTGNWIMEATLQWDLRSGSFFSSMIFIFPPMFFLGMISPLLIRLNATESHQAGRVSGYVYAVSTLGGVGATFLLGFFLIPLLGLKKPLFIFAVLLALPPLVSLFFRSDKKESLTLILLLFTFLLSSLAVLSESGSSGKQNALASITGMNGNMLVVEEAHSRGKTRSLYLNGLPQTIEFMETRCPGHKYVLEMSQISGLFPSGSRVLQIGVGGGSLVKELLALGFTIDAIELDPRILEAAEKWFDTPLSQINAIPDDARHVLNLISKSYDLVIMDAFFGDNPPWQLITRESFARLRSHLNPGGILLFYYPGPILGPEGVPAQGLINTLKSEGFYVQAVSSGVQGQGGRIFIASLNPFSYSDFPEGRRTRCVKASGLPLMLPLVKEFHYDFEGVFTDESPLLETLWNPSAFTRKRIF